MWVQVFVFSTIFAVHNAIKFGDASSQKQYLTILGKICKDSCEKRGKDYNWCNVFGGSWDFCSGSNGEDTKGNACVNSKCDKYHKGKTYCYLDFGGWNYCGVVKTIVNKPESIAIPKSKKKIQHISVSGKQCQGECHKRGYDYYYCNTEDGSWDYCSMTEDFDKYGRACVAPCGSLTNNGKTYCNLKIGSWEYCGTRGINQECEPNLEFERVAHKDNTLGHCRINYIHRERTGLTKSDTKRTSITHSKSASGEVIIGSDTDAGISLGSAATAALKRRFESRFSGSIQHQSFDEKSLNSGFEAESEHTNSYVILPGIDFSLYQLIGRCGSYVIQTNSFQIENIRKYESDYPEEGGAEC